MQHLPWATSIEYKAGKFLVLPFSKTQDNPCQDLLVVDTTSRSVERFHLDLPDDYCQYFLSNAVKTKNHIIALPYGLPEDDARRINSNKLFKFDINTEQFELLDVKLDENGIKGASPFSQPVVVNNKVYAAPYNSNTLAHQIFEFNPENNQQRFFNTKLKDNKIRKKYWSKGVVADGKIYWVPRGDGLHLPYILSFDPMSMSSELINVSSKLVVKDDYMFSSAAYSELTKKIYVVPEGSSKHFNNILVFDPKTNNADAWISRQLSKVNRKFHGLHIAQNGKLFAIPFQKHMNQVMAINPKKWSNTLIDIPNSIDQSLIQFWSSSAIEYDGKIFLWPLSVSDNFNQYLTIDIDSFDIEAKTYHSFKEQEYFVNHIGERLSTKIIMLPKRYDPESENYLAIYDLKFQSLRDELKI